MLLLTFCSVVLSCLLPCNNTLYNYKVWQHGLHFWLVNTVFSPLICLSFSLEGLNKIVCIFNIDFFIAHTEGLIAHTEGLIAHTEGLIAHTEGLMSDWYLCLVISLIKVMSKETRTITKCD